MRKFLGHSSIMVTDRFYDMLCDEAATKLARLTVYGETLRLEKSAEPDTTEALKAAG